MIDENKNILAPENEASALKERVKELEIYEKFYSKLLNKIRENSDDANLLNYLNQQITGGATTKLICQVFSEQVNKIFNAASSLYLLSQNKKILRQQNFLFDDAQRKLINQLIGSSLPLLKISLNESKIHSAILKTGIPLITIESEIIELLLKEGLRDFKMEGFAESILKILEFKTVILLPLKSFNEMIGLMEIGRKKEFVEAEIHRLQIMADSVGGIIKRAMNEKEYLEAEELQTQLIDNAGIAVYKQDLEDKIIFFNHNFTELSGYSPTELVDMSITQIIHQQDGEKFENFCQQIFERGESKAENFKTISKNKTVALVKILAKPQTENGEAIGILGYVWKMEELRAEQAKIDRLAISRDLIIKELSHRFKNNMVVISSLLALQAKNVTDEKLLAVLKEGQTRIRTMTLLHEKLYLTKELPQLHFSTYIKELATELFHLYNFDPELIKLKITIEDIDLDMDYAVPCGLILNELISNSLKYAFVAGEKGQIIIKMESLANDYLLTYGDSGAGLPRDFDLHKANTLGMQIILMLVEELDGSIQLLKDKFTYFQIKFPKINKSN